MELRRSPTCKPYSVCVRVFVYMCMFVYVCIDGCLGVGITVFACACAHVHACHVMSVCTNELVCCSSFSTISHGKVTSWFQAGHVRVWLCFYGLSSSHCDMISALSRYVGRGSGLGAGSVSVEDGKHLNLRCQVVGRGGGPKSRN